MHVDIVCGTVCHKTGGWGKHPPSSWHSAFCSTFVTRC